MLSWLDANSLSMLNGVALAAVLFLIAVGLSLVFGMTRVVNFAHGDVLSLAALSLFETAAREKRLTVTLVRDLSRFLQHARLDRNLTFESFCESST